MPDKVHPLPTVAEAAPVANVEDPENPPPTPPRARRLSDGDAPTKRGDRAKSGLFTSSQLQGGTLSRNQPRHKADSIFDVGAALERGKRRKASGKIGVGTRRHTMMAITSQASADLTAEASKDGADGEGEQGENYFDLKKTATSASRDIKKDIGELGVILEALDPDNQQTNLKRHMKSALTRVNDNLKHIGFLQVGLLGHTHTLSLSLSLSLSLLFCERRYLTGEAREKG